MRLTHHPYTARRRLLLSTVMLSLIGAPMTAKAAAHYAVVVGDSIAEGEIERKGRLNVQGQFVPDYPSQPGQLSHELASYSGVFHFNHGIGGQTSSHIRARWPRDVLAQQFDPGDGRGPRTLPARTKPSLVYLHAGINDIALAQTPLQTMQDNFRYFASSLAERGIPLVIDNIGAYLGMTDAMGAQASAFNSWLRDELAPAFPNVRVVDYLNWSSGGTNDYRTLAAGKFADGVHPSAQGYIDFAQYIRNNVTLPSGSIVRY